MADEKSPMRISRRPVALKCSGMRIKMNIKEIINCIEKLTEEMFRADINIYEKINGILSDVQREYGEFIALMPELNRIGMDMDADAAVAQLRNLSDAIEHRDTVQLYDTLKCEISDTLGVYAEIKNIMEQG